MKCNIKLGTSKLNTIIASALGAEGERGGRKNLPIDETTLKTSHSTF
jgi:hypothetical protein